MQDILVQLNRVRGVGGSLLVSNEGLPIASALRDGTDEARLAAEIGPLIEHANLLCQHLSLGVPRHFQANGSHGTLLMTAAGSGYLVVLVDPGANLAMLQLETKPFLERLAQRLSL
jgi:predicted regulator of Ras-like GTPase activity (Roadblock/LC7/MglB family)